MLRSRSLLRASVARALHGELFAAAGSNGVFAIASPLASPSCGSCGSPVRALPPPPPPLSTRPAPRARAPARPADPRAREVPRGHSLPRARRPPPAPAPQVCRGACGRVPRSLVTAPPAAHPRSCGCAACAAGPPRAPPPALRAQRRASHCDCPGVEQATRGPDVTITYDPDDVQRFIDVADAIESEFPDLAVEGVEGRSGQFSVTKGGAVIYQPVAPGPLPDAADLATIVRANLANARDGGGAGA